MLRNMAPAGESHGPWPRMNMPTFGRDVAPFGRESGTTGFARGASLTGEIDAVKRMVTLVR